VATSVGVVIAGWAQQSLIALTRYVKLSRGTARRSTNCVAVVGAVPTRRSSCASDVGARQISNVPDEQAAPLRSLPQSVTAGHCTTIPGMEHASSSKACVIPAKTGGVHCDVSDGPRHSTSSR
jgi:hypothetical protein